MIKIAYAPVYKYQLPPGHRFPMEKYDLLPQQLVHEGIAMPDQFFVPDQLELDVLFLTHTQQYYHELISGQLSKKAARKIGFPVKEALITRGLCIAQGTIECCLSALKYGIALNIAGGTHHAYADHGEGFCVFNDFAIAANYLLNREIVKQILIVDLDVHQGNGSAHIFSKESRVFTFSMHGANNYPLRKEKSDLDIGLPDGTTDDQYHGILSSHLPSIVESVRPDLIMYLAGADVIKQDALGRLSLSKGGAYQRDLFVFEICQNHQIPCVVSMGGGYAPQIRDVLDVHANTYRAAEEIFHI